MKNYETPDVIVEDVNSNDVLTNSELNESPFVGANLEF